MGLTLSNGTTTIQPDSLEGFASESQHGNIVHQLLGVVDVDAVLRPAGLRTGSLTLGIIDEAAAYAAEQALRGAHVWTATHDAFATVGMTFVVQGMVSRRLEPQTGAGWFVEFGYHEVTP